MVLWPLLLHTLYSLIYIKDDVCFLHLCLTCVVSFLSLYTCFFLYTTCLCFTLDALMNLVLSVLDKTDYKSITPWSLFLQIFQEFVVGLDICTFVNYGIVMLDFSYSYFLWFCHRLPKGEIVRVIFYCNWLILWQNALYL